MQSRSHLRQHGCCASTVNMCMKICTWRLYGTHTSNVNTFIVLLMTCALFMPFRVTLGSSKDAETQATTPFSSLIRTISRNKVLWEVSQGSCNSAQLINMSSSQPLWQKLPLGSHKSQDFSQALVWESNLLYTLRHEPALIAIGTRHGNLAFEWPKRSFPIYRWFQPRAIDLPKGAHLVGPVLCGDRVVLRSQGPTPGSSSKIFAIFAGNGTFSWGADVGSVVSDWDERVPISITDVVFNNPGVIVTSAYASRPTSKAEHSAAAAAAADDDDDDDDDDPSDLGGAAMEWFSNGTLRWATEFLDPSPNVVAGSTELMAVLISSPTSPHGGVTLYGIDRETGQVAWTSTCLVSCRVQVIDTHTLLVHEDPETLMGLRALDMASGKPVWTISRPQRPTLRCGSTVLTSSDLVVACQCGPPFVSIGKELSQQKDFGTKTNDNTGNISNLRDSDKRLESICMYSIKPTNGKIQWESEILSAATPLPDEASDELPDEALSNGQQPAVLADSLVVLTKHSVISVQRRPSLLPGPDGRKGGEVLWRLSLPPGSVATSQSRLELHGGILLLVTSSESDDGNVGDTEISSDGKKAKSAGIPTGRVMLAIRPSTGQIVWQTPLEATLMPATPQPLVFSPGRILINRCNTRSFGAQDHSPKTADPQIKARINPKDMSSQDKGKQGMIAQRSLTGWWDEQSGFRAVKVILTQWSDWMLRYNRREGEKISERSKSSDAILMSNGFRGTSMDHGASMLGSVRDGDVFCCLDALSDISGELLWSSCYDQSQSCRTGQSREILEVVVDTLLVVQLMAVLAGLGSVLVYRLYSQPVF